MPLVREVLVSTYRALVVEDDLGVSMVIAETLRTAGFEVTTVANGEDALDTVLRDDPHLVTLDLILPGMDGVEVCRRLRENSDCYVVMITARHEEIDRLVGLEVGADDYMVKPFSPRELRARVAALFRRPRSGEPPSVTTKFPVAPDLDLGGGLLIRRARREVVCNGQVVPLTRTEFDLLSLLAERMGTVCSRGEIVQAIWDTTFTDDQHLVDVHIANLRAKLRRHSSEAWVHTVRSIGYRLDPGP